MDRNALDRNAFEINFDGLVGPTHNYGGLSYGNTASKNNQFLSSNPRDAALQGLDKMKFLADRGIGQAVLPPQERPFIPLLRQLGYQGNDQTIIKSVYKQRPELLLAISSAAAMWTANAATVCPSIDSQDGYVHLTPANLSSKFHRSIEAEMTSKLLKAIFHDSRYFIHHDCLPPGSQFSDEGAANHTRLCKAHQNPGVHLFVFGKYAFQQNSRLPKIYPARQTFEASEAISRLHQLKNKQIIFIQQHPTAIDAGAFHNDVVSVGNENVFLYHEKAFSNQKKNIEEITKKVAQECHTRMILLEVKNKDLSIHDAISSYFFNSQLITLPNGDMALLSPIECQETPSIKAYADSLLSSTGNPIQEIHYLNLRQSMQNGGGPACLRLRVVLTTEELKATHQGVFFNDDLYHKLKKWVIVNYRDRLHVEDLSDPKLHEEGNKALDELTKILGLGSIYSFQL